MKKRMIMALALAMMIAVLTAGTAQAATQANIVKTWEKCHAKNMVFAGILKVIETSSKPLYEWHYPTCLP